MLIFNEKWSLSRECDLSANDGLRSRRRLIRINGHTLELHDYGDTPSDNASDTDSLLANERPGQPCYDPKVRALLRLLTDGLRSGLRLFQDYVNGVVTMLAHVNQGMWPDDENWECTIDNSTTKCKEDYCKIMDRLAESYKALVRGLPPQLRPRAASLFASSVSLIRSFFESMWEKLLAFFHKLKEPLERAADALRGLWLALKQAYQVAMVAILGNSNLESAC